MLRLADPTKLSLEEFESKITVLVDCVLPLPNAFEWTGERPFACAILSEILLEFEDVSSQDVGKKTQEEIDSEIASLNDLVKERVGDGFHKGIRAIRDLCCCLLFLIVII